MRLSGLIALSLLLASCEVNFDSESGPLRTIQESVDRKGAEMVRAEVAMAVGQVDLDVSGDYKHSVEVKVNGGVGQAIVHLPKGIGVRVDAKGGIGGIGELKLTVDSD